MSQEVISAYETFVHRGAGALSTADHKKLQRVVRDPRQLERLAIVLNEKPQRILETVEGRPPAPLPNRDTRDIMGFLGYL